MNGPMHRDVPVPAPETPVGYPNSPGIPIRMSEGVFEPPGVRIRLVRNHRVYSRCPGLGPKPVQRPLASRSRSSALCPTSFRAVSGSRFCFFTCYRSLRRQRPVNADFEVLPPGEARFARRAPGSSPLGGKVDESQQDRKYVCTLGCELPTNVPTALLRARDEPALFQLP